MPGKPAHASSPTQQRVRLPLNWSLILGLILVVIVLYFAFMGPNLAPADPMRENYIAKVNGAFVRPPFPAFTVPGYPLGSDEFGRDILSRLLCGIKPTLMVGLVVAGIRLLLGVVIGVLTGWFSGRFSAALRWLTGVALSAPVIFFAIFIISLLGQSMGLWAFVIGLSLTGWAETARLISEQTRLVKVQPYVKAADALGATSLQTLILHVLPQVVSLVWVMLAFEISSSILSLAGLGVIGYFISFIWIQNGDWTTLRASGKPELGQLLAGVTSMDSQPWGVIAAGTVVFLIILSFNLLGEGIRRQLRPEAQSHHKGWIGQAFDNTGSWIEDQLVSPTSRLRSINPIIPAAAMLAILLIGGGAMLWRGQAEPPSQLNVSVPGGALWASSQHDAHATRLAAIERIDLPEVEWVFANPNEKPFSTNPVVSVDGTIYLVDAQGMLYAVRADGGLAWSVQLPNPVWVSPAIGTNGEIYLADETASLMAYSPRGSLLWSVPPDEAAIRDSALTGPIVDAVGQVYLATQYFMVAVSSQGELLWRNDLPTYSYTDPVIRLSPDNRLIFMEDGAVETQAGNLYIRPSVEPLDKYIIGADGRIYLHDQTTFYTYHQDGDKAVLIPGLSWDVRTLGLGMRTPNDAGVTARGRTWMYYKTGFDYPKIIWFDRSGELMSIQDYPYQVDSLVGIDDHDTTYMCGVIPQQAELVTECRAVSPTNGRVLWKLTLEDGIAPIGGALAPNHLYLSNEMWLYSIAGQD